jgi:hypothetical protein
MFNLFGMEEYVNLCGFSGATHPNFVVENALPTGEASSPILGYATLGQLPYRPADGLLEKILEQKRNTWQGRRI